MHDINDIKISDKIKNYESIRYRKTLFPHLFS